MKPIRNIKPNHLLSAVFLLQLVLHLAGNLLGWKTFYSSLPAVIIGCGIAVSGMFIHMRCHKYHENAHKTSEAIETVITGGLFSKIRHPMYLGLIMVSWGVYIAWDFIVMIPFPLLFFVLIFYLAKKEEAYLTEHLGDAYVEYKKTVKWMFIPRII